MFTDNLAMHKLENCYIRDLRFEIQNNEFP